MKKFLLVSILAIMMVVVFAVPAMAVDEYTDGVIKSEHKVLSKWDLAGTYTTVNAGYNWAGFSPIGTSWTYEIHAKEATEGKVSSGVVKFLSSTGVEFTGQVDYVKSGGYSFWSNNIAWNLHRTNVLALAGTGTYNDTKYYFMVLTSEECTWLALSTTSYDAVWDVQKAWGAQGSVGVRAYQTSSDIVDDQFDVDPKFVR